MYEAYAEYRGDDLTPDPLVLKKLRLRVETDDQLFPPLKKLKICGMDLEELPPEVFHMFELEVRFTGFVHGLGPLHLWVGLRLVEEI